MRKPNRSWNAALAGAFVLGFGFLAFTADARVQTTDVARFREACASINGMSACPAVLVDCTGGDMSRLDSCNARLTAGGKWCEAAFARYHRGGDW